MLASFAERSREAELMDGADYTAAEMIENLADLRRVNRYLGGRRALTRHLFPMIQTAWATGLRRGWLLDVGAGGGDNPAGVGSWGRGRGGGSGIGSPGLNESRGLEGPPPDLGDRKSETR